MQNTQCNLKKVNFTPIENEKVKSYFINSSQTLMRSFHFKNGENWIYQERLRTTQVRPWSNPDKRFYYTHSRYFNEKISIVQIVVSYH